MAWWVVAVSLLVDVCIALDNGLALTPPMGWSSWNHFGCSVTEQNLLDTAKVLVDSGLRDVGYRYVNVDDCWMQDRNNNTNEIVANPSKFPTGIEGLTNELHRMNLRFGIYSASSSVVCSGRPGSLYLEDLDARTYAKWGADYLKFDNCGEYALDPEVRTQAMRDALNRTGRAMVLSFEPFAIMPDEYVRETAHLWRTTKDIKASWDTILNRADLNDKWAHLAGPGGWNDPDMLEVGNGALTSAEQRTHFVLWVVAKAPLILGADLTKLTAEQLSLLGNRELLDINQDSLGVQGRKLMFDGRVVPTLVGVRPCLRQGPPRELVAQTFDLVSLPSSHFNVRLTSDNVCLTISDSVYRAATGAPVVLLPCNSSDQAQSWSFSRGVRTVSSLFSASASRALGVANSTLWSATNGNDPLPLPDQAYGNIKLELQTLMDEPPCRARTCENYHPEQMWYYDSVGHRLRASTYTASINHCFDGDCYELTRQMPTTERRCLAAVPSIANKGTASGQHEVWGGPLSGNSYVVALVNRGASAATINANFNLLTRSPSSFCVRDLLAKKSLGVKSGSISADVGVHDVAVFKLVPGSTC